MPAENERRTQPGSVAQYVDGSWSTRTVTIHRAFPPHTNHSTAECMLAQDYLEARQHSCHAGTLEVHSFTADSHRSPFATFREGSHFSAMTGAGRTRQDATSTNDRRRGHHPGRNRCRSLDTGNNIFTEWRIPRQRRR
ncbi:hypothetical protein L210DRAFT_3568630 [Boletus edulis BED1]|uniref:Uncharacterized protein n=1 Tax=Boletus edulis BED1 TaxID=1328754 RepID=A0AAD4BE27_BOLED|nr:hypothetical protein L210DRAFT_3568630 [Boletus edulis BED1]